MGCQESNLFSCSSAYKEDSVALNIYPDISCIDDLLKDILSFLPYKDIIHNCRLVCKKWRDIIDGHCVWKAKCEQELKLPVFRLETIPNHFYRTVYVHCVSEKNLVKNPCGDVNKLEGWSVCEVGIQNYDPFCTEKNYNIRASSHPHTCDPVPAEVGTQSCFEAYTPLGCFRPIPHYRFRKYQIIDLYEEELNKFLLSFNIPIGIKVGEWYSGGGFFRGPQYEFIVLLLDEKKKEVDSFKFTEERWLDRKWLLVTHEFNNVTNVRYVHFEHSGVPSSQVEAFELRLTGSFVKLQF